MSLTTGSRWEESGSNSKKTSVVVLGDLDGALAGGGGSGPSRRGVKGQELCQRERKLTLLVILLSVVCFGLVVYNFVAGPLSSLLIPEIKGGGSGFTGICDSIECVDISYRSLHSGHFGQSPCDDFYTFACSKWQLENPISHEELYLAANINQIRDRVDLYIKRLLEKLGENGTKEYASPRAFYESCLNFSSPDESYIISDLIKSVGGYKSLEAWSESEFDLTRVILSFLQLNAAPLFDLTLDIDPRDRTKYALIVELPRPTSLVPNLFQPLSRQDDVLATDRLMYELTDATDSISINENEIDMTNSSDVHHPSTVDRKVVYKLIRNSIEAKKVARLQQITKKIGELLTLSDEEVNSDVQEISSFASNLEKIKPSQKSRKLWKQQNKVYNEISIDGLQRLFGSIDWKLLFRELLEVQGHTIQDNQEQQRGPPNGLPSWENLAIYVPYPDYLSRLARLIQTTDKRLLSNGMLVMYVKDMLNDIIPKKKENEPRWKFCVHSTKSVFAMELSSLYLRSFDSKHLQRVRNDVEDIFENVKGSLVNFLNRSSWQDPKSREESIKKVASLKGNFLGPSFYFKDDYLDDGIKDIRIFPKDFYRNVKIVYRTFREQLYKLYWKKVDEDRATWSFVTFPTTVNAFYIQQFNSLVVPLAFLNPPHYVHGAPKYVNYATIALTIAHEALHSLDSSGSDFNADGKLLDWFDGEQRGFLKEKSSCVAKQYPDTFRRVSEFQKTHIVFQVDGNLTQNENLADIAGLQVAYNAYLKQRLHNNALKPERKLPGLPFNLEQTFFLSVAQAYCANISPMGYIFLLEIDEHTPHPERINGMLMNIPEFSKAFNCPLGTTMNPTLKCSLW